MLTLSCRLHPRADHRRRLAQSLAREFLIRHARHLHVNINPVEQGAADPQGPLRLCAFGSASPWMARMYILWSGHRNSRTGRDTHKVRFCLTYSWADKEFVWTEVSAVL